MTKLKEAAVVMLATKDVVPLRKQGNAIINNCPSDYAIHSWKPQHLYFLSNDEITRDDWYIWLDNNQIAQAIGALIPLNTHLKQGHVKKIIATTDPALKVTGVAGFLYLPSPPKKFLEDYCDAGGIDKVMVEYKYLTSAVTSILDNVLVIKVDYSNQITIHPIKTTWNRDEVEELCENAYDTGASYMVAKSNVSVELEFINWKKQNL